MRVLIADDDPTYRSLLGGLLTSWDFDAVVVSNGSDALKCFEASLESSDDLESQEEQEMELFTAVLENISRIRIAANEPLDDLFEYVNRREVDVDALEGWRLMRRGQELASDGLWNEAWMMMGRGESVFGYGGEPAPMRFVWCSIGLSDWMNADGSSGLQWKGARAS